MLTKAFLMDDEPLAIKRLAMLIGGHTGIEIISSSSDPNTALDEVRLLRPDVLFLAIEMPGISGFQFLERLGVPQPVVVFTTAYDPYAPEYLVH